MARVRATEDMVRIVIYSDDDSRNGEGMTQLAQRLSRSVGGASGYIPRMFYLAPDGTPMAYVDYQQKEEAAPEGDKVLQVMQWASGVERQVARADRMAERGRYAEAMREIDEIADQDSQVSHLIQVMLGHAEEGDDAPETPVAPMFAGLRDEKKAAYEALAEAELAAAREMVAAEDYRGAQRALRGLMRGPDEFATTAQAKALYEEVVEKLRSQ